MLKCSFLDEKRAECYFGEMISRLLMVGCALIGGAISLYFALVTSGKMPTEHWLVPRICRMNEETCGEVIRAREARIFGIPNAHLGLAMYGIVALCALMPESVLRPYAYDALLAVVVVAVLVGIYLTYVLLVRMHARCWLCIVCHSMNLVILIVLLNLS